MVVRDSSTASTRPSSPDTAQPRFSPPIWTEPERTVPVSVRYVLAQEALGHLMQHNTEINRQIIQKEKEIPRYRRLMNSH